MYFTVITPNRVLRLKAKSIQQATQALHAAHIEVLSIEQDS